MRDDDILSGNDGIDDLFGGTGDDQLSGGKGADLMDGEGGIDTVDYSRANRDTQQGVFVTITLAGDVIGHGGEAEGDRLVSIESLIGTDFGRRLPRRVWSYAESRLRRRRRRGHPDRRQGRGPAARRNRRRSSQRR